MEEPPRKKTKVPSQLPAPEGLEHFRIEHECRHTRARAGVLRQNGTHPLQTPALISQSRFGSVPFLTHDNVEKLLAPTQGSADPNDASHWGLCLPFADMLLLGRDEQWCIGSAAGSAHSEGADKLGAAPQTTYLSTRDSLQFPPYGMKESGSTTQHMVLNTSRGRVKVTPSVFMDMVSN